MPLNVSLFTPEAFDLLMKILYWYVYISGEESMPLVSIINNQFNKDDTNIFVSHPEQTRSL